VLGGVAGHHATDGHEPRQIRKEAAISDVQAVSWIDPGHGNDLWIPERIRQRVHNHFFAIAEFGIKRIKPTARL